MTLKKVLLFAILRFTFVWCSECLLSPKNLVITAAVSLLLLVHILFEKQTIVMTGEKAKYRNYQDGNEKEKVNLDVRMFLLQSFFMLRGRGSWIVDCKY